MMQPSEATRSPRRGSGPGLCRARSERGREGHGCREQARRSDPPLLRRLAADRIHRGLPPPCARRQAGDHGVSANEHSPARALGLAIRLVPRPARPEPRSRFGWRARSWTSAMPIAAPLAAPNGVMNRLEVDADPVGRVSFEGPGRGARHHSAVCGFCSTWPGRASTWPTCPAAPQLVPLHDTRHDPPALVRLPPAVLPTKVPGRLARKSPARRGVPCRATGAGLGCGPYAAAATRRSRGRSSRFSPPTATCHYPILTLVAGAIEMSAFVRQQPARRRRAAARKVPAHAWWSATREFLPSPPRLRSSAWAKASRRCSIRSHRKRIGGDLT